MTYVDGFVAAVPTASKEAYRKHAEDAAIAFKEHGALSLVECWGDDVPEGKINSMHTAVLRKDDETVVFSWIIWPDRATSGCIRGCRRSSPIPGCSRTSTPCPSMAAG